MSVSGLGLGPAKQKSYVENPSGWLGPLIFPLSSARLIENQRAPLGPASLRIFPDGHSCSTSFSKNTLRLEVEHWPSGRKILYGKTSWAQRKNHTLSSAFQSSEGISLAELNLFSFRPNVVFRFATSVSSPKGGKDKLKIHLW